MAVPPSPYLKFTQSLLEKNLIDFKIVNGELSFGEDIPAIVENRFRDYYIFKLDVVMAKHPMHGHFIITRKPLIGSDPCIMWSEASELYPPD